MRSEAGTESILEAGRHNATAYLVKPFSVEKIVYVLKKIFRSRSQWSLCQDWAPRSGNACPMVRIFRESGQKT